MRLGLGIGLHNGPVAGGGGAGGAAAAFFVTASHFDPVIYKIETDGTVRSWYDLTGQVDDEPVSLVFDSAGSALYVLTGYNASARIFKFTDWAEDASTGPVSVSSALNIYGNGDNTWDYTNGRIIHAASAAASTAWDGIVRVDPDGSNLTSIVTSADYDSAQWWPEDSLIWAYEEDEFKRMAYDGTGNTRHNLLGAFTCFGLRVVPARASEANGGLVAAFQTLNRVYYSSRTVPGTPGEVDQVNFGDINIALLGLDYDYGADKIYVLGKQDGGATASGIWSADPRTDAYPSGTSDWTRVADLSTLSLGTLCGFCVAHDGDISSLMTDVIA